MSETVLRRAYRDSRVLIDSVRVLDPQFDDAVLAFTGAQIEMMRNLAQYLNRRDTFADAYYAGYYLIPNDDDWDSLQSIISDLEDKLMGNENRIFGYNDRVWEDLGGVKSGDGEYGVYSTPVPADCVHVIALVSLANHTGARGAIQIRLYANGGWLHLAYSAAPGQYIPVQYHGSVVLKEGDRIRILQASCLSNDVLVGGIRGYVMAVGEG